VPALSGGARGSFGAARSAIRAVVANPDIRRLQVSWATGIAADWAFLIVVLVVAYEAGGAVGVGLLGLVRMIPATAIALFVTVPATLSQARVLLAINAIRAGATATAAALLAMSGPAVGIFACLAVVAGVGVLVRPTQNALLPSLARSPGELVASNVASSTGEGLGTFGGPVVAGLLVALVGPAVASAAVALAFVFAAATLAGIRAPSPQATTHGGREPAGLPFVDGLRTLAVRPATGLLIAAFTAQALVRGLLTTLTVVAAIELLRLGEPGVGLLNGALGAGGFVGALAAIALAGRRNLAPSFAVALTGWGLPIAVIGGWPYAGLAVVALLIVGVSNAILDVAGFTLLQRGIPDDRRTSVFRLLEGTVGIAVAVGSIAAPVLVEAFGVTGALGITGAILPIVAVATWPWVSRIDREAVIPERELAILRAVPMFALLPLTALERLAGSLVPLRFAAGDVLMREGEPGDRYYVVAEGRLDVSQGGRLLRHCGPGVGVGEIALLRRIPRTATVVAAEPTEVFALDSADFLAAVSGDARSAAAAERVVGERLGA
jgi:hypothetical protein